MTHLLDPSNFSVTVCGQTGAIATREPANVDCPQCQDLMKRRDIRVEVKQQKQERLTDLRARRQSVRAAQAEAKRGPKLRDDPQGMVVLGPVGGEPHPEGEEVALHSMLGASMEEAVAMTYDGQPYADGDTVHVGESVLQTVPVHHIVPVKPPTKRSTRGKKKR